MRKRINYYKELSADYSKPEPVAPALAKKLLDDAARFIEMKERTIPQVGASYTQQQIEKKTKSGGQPIARHCVRAAGIYSRVSIGMILCISVRTVLTTD